ncbi:MAG: hypothetical protein ACM33V_11225 [Chloroflexota bacterium]|nr:hypothetical protein [Anaerolineales bacterium]
MLLALMVCVSITACTEKTTQSLAALPIVASTRTVPAFSHDSLPTATSKPKRYAPITPAPTATRTSTAAPTVTPDPLERDPAKWKTWPVIPVVVDPSLQNVYERGQELGSDPHAFSLFGDCQARPDEFFGPFETDTELVSNLSPELQEAVSYFQGSFNRESPTAQDGTTPGSLLWNQWHGGKYGCSFAETPVECELRTRRPSFVIIQIGTHFESRNTEYLRKVILQLMDAGVVPILATKADNRENDERINRDMAMLAVEYDLPLWNFWAALSDLPERGLYIMKGREGQGPVYLDDEAKIRHRMTGLETLNVVWRAVTGK